MNAAKARGIASLPEFYAHLAHPGAGETEFMVKFDIVPGDRAELVWARDLDRFTSPMTGVLVNQPEETADQVGARVPLPEADIIDWSYRRGRVAQGHFTTRVLLRHMSPDETAHPQLSGLVESQHLSLVPSFQGRLEFPCPCPRWIKVK